MLKQLNSSSQELFQQSCRACRLLPLTLAPIAGEREIFAVRSSALAKEREQAPALLHEAAGLEHLLMKA